MTPWSGANGCRSMLPRSSATDVSSPLPVLFRRSPRHAEPATTGTRSPQSASKTVVRAAPALLGPATPHVQDSMDAEEAQAVRAEGLDPVLINGDDFHDIVDR